MTACTPAEQINIVRKARREAWTPGFSLPQGDYADDTVFQEDMRLLGENVWALVDHVSRIPKPGDFFVFELGNESVIVLRDRNQQIRAHFNVCRHRGSRICLSTQGSVRTLSCPYHAWTYDLEGKLISVPLDNGTIDKSAYGLHPAHVRVFHGIIFVNLSKTSPPPFEPYVERFESYLAPYNLENARVAARRTFSTNANWKLVVENFLECYHCKPAHPTYCSVHDELKMLAMGAGPGSGDEFMAKYAPIYEAWAAEERSKGRWLDPFNDSPDLPHFQSAARIPIRQGSLTESLDGRAVAPIMKSDQEFDGVQAGCVFNPVSTVLANPDHTILFRMTPRGALSTDTEAIWLVRGDADPVHDFDADRVIGVWAPTLAEDKIITENNQRGILSDRYRSGPYQSQEQRIAEFARWYRIQSGVA